MWLGSSRFRAKPSLPIEKIDEPIKILGVYFTYDRKRRKELNFESIIETIKKCLKLWSWRYLTLFGKVQILKTFIFPKVLYRASLLPFDIEICKELERLMYDFIWNKKKDKVKRTVVINQYKDGGIKMPHLETLIRSQTGFSGSFFRATTLYMEKHSSPLFEACGGGFCAALQFFS